MAGHARVKGVYSGPVQKKLDIPMTSELLDKLGNCLVEAFVHEAKKDFAKRGWSGEAMDQSPPIWDSFSYKIRGQRTIEVESTFPGLDVLTTRGSPARKLTKLTQEEKKRNPQNFPLTPKERRLRREGKLGNDERLPLVVPLKSKSGQIIFRMAPLTTADAWIHPGIARFTFAERAVRQGKAGCIEILKREAVKALVAEMST